MSASGEMPEIRPPAPGDTASRVVRWFAESQPGRVALEIDGEQVDFAVLNLDVDRLAQRLLDDAAHGLDGGSAPPAGGPGVAGEIELGAPAVAMWIEGFRAAVTASLAIARAGMVSVPVDPTTPPSRVRAIVESVGALLVLSDVDLSSDVGAPSADPLNHHADPPPGGVERAPGPVAAVVFTSGSTGEPKGIVLPIEQLPVVDDQTISAVSDTEEGARLDRSVAADAEDERLRIGYMWAGTVGNIDANMQRLFLLGGTVVAYDLRREGVARLGRWLEREGVMSCLTLVPTILRQLLAALPAETVFEKLRMVSLTGEAVSWEDVAELRAHLSADGLVYSAYGLSETGLISGMLIGAQTPIEQGPLPVGWPLPDRTVTILDSAGNELAAGEVGEIAVAGADLALGYWRRPKLSAAVFETLADGRRRVRTGDRGRLREDGVLEHLGRLDHMVKIAGNRVELGEIESLLRDLDDVAEAAASTYGDASGALRLAAFVTARDGAELDSERLREQLAELLPSALLPDRVEVLGSMPQLASGKIDRQALPAPSPRRNPARAGLVPSLPLERELAAIWAEVLGLERVDADDDFFALGGDSLRAARVFAELESRLGFDRPISLLLEAPTVAELAAAIERDASWAGLVPIQPRGSRPPLFVIHDQFGNLFQMREMAEWLGEEQPVYGVRSPALGGELGAGTSIGDVAAAYLRDITSMRPDGPYLIYGHEVGGLIAFEMALQLQSEGELDGQLVVGFMPAPRPAPPSGRELLIARARKVRSSSPAELAAAVRRRLTARVAGMRSRAPGVSITGEQRGGGSSNESAPTPAQRAELAQRTYREMARRYRPAQRLHGSMLLVKPGGANESDFGWGRYVDGEVQALKLAQLREALASGWRGGPPSASAQPGD
jgi:acyl-coenzyme A synthetase/AMP-(fatty) acid ligase/thioesterase domain-containing protein/acyl carrier protein